MRRDINSRIDWLTLAEDELHFARKILLHPDPLTELDCAAVRAACITGARAFRGAARRIVRPMPKRRRRAA